MKSVYLETNIVYGFFKEIAKSFKKKRKFMIPRIIKRFKNPAYKNKIYSSVLTKCEVARRLRTDFDHITPSDIDRMWQYLEKYLGMKTIKEINIDEDTYNMIKKNRFRFKVNNVIHLDICKKLGLILITKDKKLLHDGVKEHKHISKP
ncbi:MAG: hypothetical protein ACE5J4_00115 [Candidatus Aenigmatarchaeota archaeon]